MSGISEPYSYEERVRVLETGGQFSVGVPSQGRRTLTFGDYEFMADFSELLKRRCYRNHEMRGMFVW